MVVFKGALAALLWAWAWAWAWAGAAAQVPCSVAKEVAPGEVRRFHFQRAGSSQDLLCVFTFQTQLGAPLALVLNFLRFDNMTERDCECGELRMYDVSPSGELVSNIRRCAGEAADGVALLASSSVALLTLSTHACGAPAFALSVGPPDALGVAPGDQDGATTTTTTTTTTTEAPQSTPPPTRAPTRRPATTTTTTPRPTRRARRMPAAPATSASTTAAEDSDITTTKRSGHWWSG